MTSQHEFNIAFSLDLSAINNLHFNNNNKPVIFNINKGTENLIEFKSDGV